MNKSISNLQNYRCNNSITNLQNTFICNDNNFYRSSNGDTLIDNNQPSSLIFEDQEKIVEELAKQPSKLFDILMNPRKLSGSLSRSKQKTGIYIDPLLVRLP